MRGPGLRGTNGELDSTLDSIISSPSFSSLLNSGDGSVSRDDYAEGGGEAPADGTLNFVVRFNLIDLYGG